jgi:hypothetical protein
VVLAVGALAWGVIHNKSSGQGIGSTKDQAAARAVLVSGLKLPSGVVRDPTFTACGIVGDACLTAGTNTAETVTALVSVVHAAGGSIPDACTTTFSPPAATGANPPNFTCAVQGELKGAEVIFMLGDGWVLPAAPGKPTPRTAVLATIVTTKDPVPLTATAGSAAEVASLLPTTWSSVPEPCAGGSTPPASTTPASAPASPSASASLPPALLTAPPLPACVPNALTVDVGVAKTPLAAAAAQLSKLALSQGFRLDGNPCLAGGTTTTCGVWGGRISSSGVKELFTATLNDDGRGNTTGTLSVTTRK